MKQGTNQHKNKWVRRRLTVEEKARQDVRKWVYLLIAVACGMGIAYQVGVGFSKLPDNYSYTGIQPVYAQEESAEELSMKGWVLNRWEQEGVPPKQVEAMMMYENRGWKTDARGKNNNGSFDIGLHQINTTHNFSETCLLDYQCNTEAAIKIFKDRKRITGNGWHAWYGAEKANLW